MLQEKSAIELRHAKIISPSSQHFYRGSWMTNPLPLWGSLGKTTQVSWTALEPKAANDAVGTLQPCEWDMCWEIQRIPVTLWGCTMTLPA